MVDYLIKENPVTKQEDLFVNFKEVQILLGFTLPYTHWLAYSGKVRRYLFPDQGRSSFVEMNDLLQFIAKRTTEKLRPRTLHPEGRNGAPMKIQPLTIDYYKISEILKEKKGELMQKSQGKVLDTIYSLPTPSISAISDSSTPNTLKADEDPSDKITRKHKIKRYAIQNVIPLIHFSEAARILHSSHSFLHTAFREGYLNKKFYIRKYVYLSIGEFEGFVQSYDFRFRVNRTEVSKHLSEMYQKLIGKYGVKVETVEKKETTAVKIPVVQDKPNFKAVTHIYNKAYASGRKKGMKDILDRVVPCSLLSAINELRKIRSEFNAQYKE